MIHFCQFSSEVMVINSGKKKQKRETRQAIVLFVSLVQ